MTSLKAADAKEIASSITAIANEKLKAEKEANAGKKKHGKYPDFHSIKKEILSTFHHYAYAYFVSGAKKKQLHVGKPDDDMVADRYDDVGEDYDFM